MVLFFVSKHVALEKAIRHFLVMIFSSRYNLAKFANLRSYLTMNELGSVSGKRFQIRQQNEKEDKEREEKFISKYGSNKSKWSEEVKEMYENFEDT